MLTRLSSPGGPGWGFKTYFRGGVGSTCPWGMGGQGCVVGGRSRYQGRLVGLRCEHLPWKVVPCFEAGSKSLDGETMFGKQSLQPSWWPMGLSAHSGKTEQCFCVQGAVWCPVSRCLYVGMGREGASQAEGAACAEPRHLPTAWPEWRSRVCGTSREEGGGPEWP